MTNTIGKFIKENRDILLLLFAIVIIIVAAYDLTRSFSEQVDFVLAPHIKKVVSLTKEKTTAKLSIKERNRLLDEKLKNDLKDLCKQAIQASLELVKVLLPFMQSTESLWQTVGLKELQQCIGRWKPGADTVSTVKD